MANLDCAVILAGGEGKRMKCDKPKVLMQVLFEPMLKWVVDTAIDADLGQLCVVCGYMYEQVQGYLNGLKQQHTNYERVCCAYQSERRGTAHAVMMAEDFLKAHSGGNVLILSGDSPLIDRQTIQEAYALHKRENNAVTVIAARLQDPAGYGRVVRNEQTGALAAIVEQKDADAQTLAICEVNSGAYWFCIDDLLSVLYNIDNHNAQGEYYLPDAVSLLLENGKNAGVYTAVNANAVLGANDCMQLSQLNTVARKLLLKYHMENGVEIPCTDGVIIGPNVTFGRGCRILPCTQITGNTKIGCGCVIGPNTTVHDCQIGDGLTLHSVQCSDCKLEGESPKPFCSVSGGR